VTFNAPVGALGVTRTGTGTSCRTSLRLWAAMNLDRTVAHLAERQHGVFSHSQAKDPGATEKAIRHRIDIGRWEVVAEEVYRLPGTPRTWEQEVMILLLAAGPEAAASHEGAARLLGIPGFAHAMPEITTPRPRRHRTEHGIVHRSRVLPAHHVTVINGIRTTRIARTLFDIAGLLNPDKAERALDNCLAHRWLTNRQIGNIVGELGKRGRRGTRIMRHLLLERGEGYVATASELEARFAKLCRKYGIPEPVRQQNTGDAEKWIARVDFAFPPPLKIIIELDGRRHWLAKLEHEADLVRDAKLTAAGWRVIHFTWQQITQEPEFVVGILRQLLQVAAA
jgi:hypothetical protein